MSTPAIFQLVPDVQSYDWGKLGSESKAAQFAGAIDGFRVDEEKPYAELWMGTHPSLPSHLASSPKTTLSAHLAAHHELVGERVRARFGAEGLPFLFKVLAIRKALSIQAHPDKTLAQKLHKERPDVYKDDNHKPEMAIALTAFRGFCGFRPLPQIALYLTAVPEFSALIPTSPTSSFTASPSSTTLRAVFGALMDADPALVKEQLAALVARYSKGDGLKEEEKEVRDLVLELNEQYPGDVGVFCTFVLNVVQLKEGEAVFLKANDPHAYISGDIIECMATSDNVVRAGLTPKLRDVPTLTSMLTYTTDPPSKQLLPPASFAPSSTSSTSSPKTVLYDPPISEFSVARTSLSPNEVEVHGVVDGPSVWIFTSGSGKLGGEEVRKVGEVWFVGAGQEVELRAGEDGWVGWRAFVEVGDE